MINSKGRVKIKLGTRGSKLALVQANLVQSSLQAHFPDLEIELIEIITTGDKKQGTPEAGISDKKEWVQELEMAITNGTVDIAVHSGKDIPIDIHPDTELFPVLQRANPWDAFIGRKNTKTGSRITFKDLPKGASVGTASLRRKAQLLMMRPDLNVFEHRGNVPTRIKKLDESGELKGIVLACAGVERLNLDSEYQPFTPEQMLPAVCQGILVAQYLSGNTVLKQVLQALVHPHTATAFLAERTVAEILEGDCKSAIGIFSLVKQNALYLTSRVMTPDGKTCIEASDTSQPKDAITLGKTIGKRLLAQGASRIL